MRRRAHAAAAQVCYDAPANGAGRRAGEASQRALPLDTDARSGSIPRSPLARGRDVTLAPPGSLHACTDYDARSSLLSVPRDVLLEVDLFLDAASIRNVSATCRWLRDAHGAAVWHQLYVAKWGASQVLGTGDAAHGAAGAAAAVPQASCVPARPVRRDNDLALLSVPARASPVASAFRYFWQTIESVFTGQALRAAPHIDGGPARQLHLLAAGLPASVAACVVGQCAWPRVMTATSAAAGGRVGRTGRGTRRAVATPPSPWKVACALREGGADILRCRLCRRLDARTPAMASFEALPTQRGCAAWVVPCRCRGAVHRRCIERAIDRSPDVPRRMWVSLDRPVAHVGDRTEAGVLGGCATCGTVYRSTRRLPESFTELLHAAVQQWTAVRYSADSIMYWLGFVVLTALLEGATLRWAGAQADGTVLATGVDDVVTARRVQSRVLVASPEVGVVAAWPRPGGVVLLWWLHQMVILLHILFSPRFNRVVRQLWQVAHRPILTFYMIIYAYFVAAGAVFVCTYTPFLLRLAPRLVAPGTPAQHGWLTGFGPVGVTEALPLGLTILGWVNLVTFVPVSWIVIFIFFKTHYSIATVGDARAGSPEASHTRGLGGGAGAGGRGLGGANAGRFGGQGVVRNGRGTVALEDLLEGVAGTAALREDPDNPALLHPLLAGLS